MMDEQSKLYELLTAIDRKVTRLETLVEGFQKNDFVTRTEFEPIKKNQDDFVTLAEFEPIKKLVYGVTGLILSGVALAIMSLVVTK